jgi:DNA-binding response OmpR family regulator
VVLIVESALGAATVELQTLLAGGRLKLLTAPTVEAAVARACVEPLRAIVLQARTTPISGFAAATRIVRSATNRHTPILFLTDDLASVAGLHAASDGQLDALAHNCTVPVLASKLGAMLRTSELLRCAS